MRVALQVWLLSLAVLCGSCNDAGGGNPGATAITALQLIRDGRTSQLNDYVSSSDTGSRAFALGMFAAAFSDRGGVTRFTVDSEKITGDQARVRVTWSYRNGGSDANEFEMRRSNGRWKLHF